MQVLKTPARLLIVLLVFLAGGYCQAKGGFAVITDNWAEILYLSRRHLVLFAISSAIAILVAVPVGILLTRRGVAKYRGGLTQIVNLGTTIPTLAILALSMSVFGIGAPTAIFGLVVLTVLPIVLNTVAGLNMVPGHLIEAARGMGMTGPQILLQVELPNALFVILAGVRTALVINIGTVPLAFLIGGSGLGELIFTGIDMMDPLTLLSGAIPTSLLAVGVDFVVGQAQYWLTPRGVSPVR